MQALKELEKKLKTLIAHRLKVHRIVFNYGEDKAKAEYIKSHNVRAYDKFCFVEIVPDDLIAGVIKEELQNR